MTLEFTLYQDKNVCIWDEGKSVEKKLPILRLDQIDDGERKLELGLEMSLRQFLRKEPTKGFLKNPILNVLKSIAFVMEQEHKGLVEDIIFMIKLQYDERKWGKFIYTVYRGKLFEPLHK